MLEYNGFGVHEPVLVVVRSKTRFPVLISGPAPILEELFGISLSIQSGACRLMVAILEDAIECFLRCQNKKTTREKQLFQEAEEWIISSEVNWLCSFENICHVVGVEPDYLRRGLRKMVCELQKTKEPWHRPSRNPVKRKSFT